MTDTLVNPERTTVELKLAGEYVYVDVVRWNLEAGAVTVTLPSGYEKTIDVDRIVG
jgi:hypothetical protein